MKPAVVIITTAFWVMPPFRSKNDAYASLWISSCFYTIFPGTGNRAAITQLKLRIPWEIMKRRIKNLFAALTLGAGLCSAPNAHAALVLTLDGQGVYDTDRNITWLRNANRGIAGTYGLFGIDRLGRMNWYAAQDLIAAMNRSNYLGFNNWRLPTTLESDTSCWFERRGFLYGPNCTGSDMGHLFYNEFGGVWGSSLQATHNANLDLFFNVRSDSFDWPGYWSDTSYAPNTSAAWTFDMNQGYQYIENKGRSLYVWAVRTGGAPVSAVPEPETYTMLLAGLGLMGFTARRKKNRTA